MHRNLDARVEVLAPVEQPDLKNYLQFVLKLILSDNQQRWLMKSNGTYEKVKRKKAENKISTHKMLMQHTKELYSPTPVALITE